jgi:outer membrane protein assembly factor BamE (lipoprotein component of BamABCDE complex)
MLSLHMRILFLILLVVGFTGCTATSHRARQYSGAFDALGEGAQARALAGQIAVGDSRDHVYVALGEPLHRAQGENHGAPTLHWYYLGQPVIPRGATSPDSDTTEPERAWPAIQFLSTNEMIWGNPFSEKSYLELEVRFEGDKVAALTTRSQRDQIFTPVGRQMLRKPD